MYWLDCDVFSVHISGSNYNRWMNDLGLHYFFLFLLLFSAWSTETNCLERLRKGMFSEGFGRVPCLSVPHTSMMWAQIIMTQAPRFVHRDWRELILWIIFFHVISEDLLKLWTLEIFSKSRNFHFPQPFIFFLRLKMVLARFAFEHLFYDRLQLITVEFWWDHGVSEG